MRIIKSSMAFSGNRATAIDPQDALGPATGLALAAVASLVLWLVLAQAARWAAHAFL